jgi:hypothetical protein
VGYEPGQRTLTVKSAQSAMTQIDDTLYLLQQDPAGNAKDQTWFHLGENSNLIQVGTAAQDDAPIVINVVGIFEQDGLDPYVLLLG